MTDMCLFSILENGECNYNIVRDVIDLYLERDVWYLPTSVDDNSATNTADAQKNVIQICLMTEGLGQLVSSLPVSKQNLCLIHCLYPVLERVGSELGSISLAGNIILAQHKCYYAILKAFFVCIRSRSNNVTRSVR